MGKARQPFVGLVHAGGEAVADELDGPAVAMDFHQSLPLPDVHRVDLHAVRPVRHAELEPQRVEGVARGHARGLRGHEQMRAARRDVAEDPVHTADAATSGVSYFFFRISH